ncbi:phosphatase PAP2 family protein [Sporosarcina gallistercoris]|uniref:Phosphatase PAP2 family protein n=1 Tax=Sporosarcina gallistercoris TaxID=2762245 RepID=A0ABR8PHF3_9BACL|nr:phosphatase PAP2 family protein [Sporosarcina gallistercoris]MBD7907592.1 phosphatase PAP2 family protein [Sporosarcina gallistercoris]
MRELSGRLITAFVSCLILAAVFGYVASSIGNGSIVQFDRPVIDFVQGAETPWLTEVMKVFTTIGSTEAVIAISVITLGLLLYFRQKAQSLLFLIVIGGTAALNLVLKLFYQRARPDLNRLIEISGYSFPSGHTMMATSLYIILAFILWRNARTSGRILYVIGAIFMISMICISRIYLGVHYPSDVVGGIISSAFWLLIAISVYTVSMNKRHSKSNFSVR